MNSPRTEKWLFHSLGVLYRLQIIIGRGAHFKVKSSQMLYNGVPYVGVNQLHSAATVSRQAKENVD